MHIPPQNKQRKGAKEKEAAKGKENGEDAESCKLKNPQAGFSGRTYCKS